LFSAGTDTSILAYEALKFKPDLKALTIVFKQGKPEDIEFVKRMVAYLKLNHEFQVFNASDAASVTARVINILKTFDPMQVRHSIPVYIGLMKAKEKDLKSVFTGDGMDELFGYPWLFHLPENELKQSLQNMWEEMTFSSIPLGESIGIDVKTPYLDPLFMDYAKKLPLDSAKFSIATPYPGTELYRIALSEGMAIQKDWSKLHQGVGFSEYDPVWIPKGRDPKELKKLQRRAHLEFYLSPRRLFYIPRIWDISWKNVKSWEDIKMYWRIGKSLLARDG